MRPKAVTGYEILAILVSKFLFVKKSLLALMDCIPFGRDIVLARP